MFEQSLRFAAFVLEMLNVCRGVEKWSDSNLSIEGQVEVSKREMGASEREREKKRETEREKEREKEREREREREKEREKEREERERERRA